MQQKYTEGEVSPQARDITEVNTLRMLVPQLNTDCPSL
jgi:hypothetical protein